MLWALTTLFNAPAGSQRLANYHAFRARLGVPLLTVELALDGQAFALGDSDADRLVQLKGGDLMWQKERLLNIGLAHLPAGCTAVSALDADLVFIDPGWPAKTLLALRDHALVQPFSTAHYLPAHCTSLTETEPSELVRQQSAAQAMQLGCSAIDCFGPQGGDGRGPASGGLATVYRRALLDRHGFYTRCIIGGGDTAMMAACFGAFATVEQRHVMTAAQRQAYRAWAEPWFAQVRGSVGFIEGEVLHLWHGALQQRGAASRHPQLAACDFDPASDLAGAAHEPWRWSGHNPALPLLMQRYFNSRGEH